MALAAQGALEFQSHLGYDSATYARRTATPGFKIKFQSHLGYDSATYPEERVQFFVVYVGFNPTLDTTQLLTKLGPIVDPATFHVSIPPWIRLSYLPVIYPASRWSLLRFNPTLDTTQLLTGSIWVNPSGKTGFNPTLDTTQLLTISRNLRDWGIHCFNPTLDTTQLLTKLLRRRLPEVQRVSIPPWIRLSYLLLPLQITQNRGLAKPNLQVSKFS